MLTENKARIAAKWNAHAGKTKGTKSWDIPQYCAYMNIEICGEPLPAVSRGPHMRLKELGPFKHAVSVGCGRATKEQALLKSGTVERFDLFDLSDQRLKVAKARYEEKGQGDKANFVVGDAFATTPRNTYDLVYWSASLHHMMDARAALEWSREVLKPGGVLMVHEYTGPTRWQWSDDMLDCLYRFRAALPPHLRPDDPSIKRPTVEQMIARDPSEAADSEAILPALKELFPDAEMRALGGAIFPHALRGIYDRMTPEDDWVFDMVLALDAAFRAKGDSHRSFALARKR
ncbi:class I SAM-dependent methyltransferase [Parvibaculum sp.]|uniref:class I SAM-dependent methyltransferase n=1 Tax=Parvibaculum sp. TaxID=2024848 RepID=UPI00391AD6BD